MLSSFDPSFSIMAPSLSKSPHFFLILSLILIIFIQFANSLNNNNNNEMILPPKLELKSLCKTTPYPNDCLNTLKLTISLNLPLTLLNILLQSLQNALSEATKLSSLFDATTNYNLIEKQRGSLLDCKELHHISLLSLQKSMSKVKASNLTDARVFLSAALSNKETCLEGLASASGPWKPLLVSFIANTYNHVSNSLSMLGSDPPQPLPPSSWSLSSKILGDNDYGDGDNGGDDDDGGVGYDDDDLSETIIVAADGSGNFTSVQEGVDFAPNNSEFRTFIYVRKGVYEENVEIPSYKPNIVLLGDGSDVTMITGNRSVADGWTTFRSATVAVSGEGFLARDITFANTAGPEKAQAAALRINADLTAVYRCNILGYQDTLYVHSFRQFYRECNIYGTIDYIFGNAAVVLQGCTIVSRMPLSGQYTVITAQSRVMPNENTGIVLQNCTVLATEELNGNKSRVQSYLGRPWRPYARTVYIESYIDEFIDPKGWIKWSSNDFDDMQNCLYYGEFENRGPGSITDGRVNWGGYHVMDYYDASNFTVHEFIVGEQWLDSTSFPYDEGI